jgi:DNA-binding GntR family transcriptional regulator
MSTVNVHRAYEHIRGKLVAGELTPGTRVRYGPIGREIGVSATPVREAVGQLASEGLLELVPNRGAVVRRPSREEIVELYEIREALESMAAEKAATRLDRADRLELSRLRQSLRKIAERLRHSDRRTLTSRQMQTFLKLDMQFHSLILAATGNQRLVKMIGDLQILTRLFFEVPRPAHGLGQIADAWRFHSRILQAVDRGDGRSAREWMARHIRAGLRNTLDLYDGQKREQSRHRYLSILK